MKGFKKLLKAVPLVVSVMVFGWVSMGASAAVADELQIGDVAPNFELLNQQGELIRLSAYQGQWVVLYFYPKNDTPGCTAEACSFRDNINHLIDQKSVILGVSVDSIESHKKFSEKFNLPFSLLADSDATVTKEYGALLNLLFMKFAKRHSFIIDPTGTIVKIYREVDPDIHVVEVLKDLKQLQQAERSQ
ncbi:MAG: peroxiredoxin [Gammaproteobacteria bacterium]|nr:peroxiredoxin [Gammaproteobacteria bacterium]